MKKNRILSFQMAQKLSLNEIREVSAAGMTTRATSTATASNGNFDRSLDTTVDFN